MDFAHTCMQQSAYHESSCRFLPSLRHKITLNIEARIIELLFYALLGTFSANHAECCFKAGDFCKKSNFDIFLFRVLMVNSYPHYPQEKQYFMKSLSMQH